MKNQKIYYYNKWIGSKSNKIFIRKSPIKNIKIKYSECNILDLKNVIQSAKIGYINNKNYSLTERSKILKKSHKL